MTVSIEEVRKYALRLRAEAEVRRNAQRVRLRYLLRNGAPGYDVLDARVAVAKEDAKMDAYTDIILEMME